MKPLTTLIALSIAILSITGAQNTTPSALSAPLSSRINAFVAERMSAGKLPGLSLVIVQEGKVAYTKGYGLANLEQKTPMTERTRVAIGSTTKGMTALAVMQLVEQGKLNLDVPIVKYLPWFKLDDPRGNAITLRHLLTHTSGLPLGTKFDGNRNANALEQHIQALSTTQLHRAPGGDFEYANDGYAVTGLVVQAVSGMSYADYMTKFVFAPLGMQDATFDLGKAQHEGAAQGYIKQRGSFVPRPMLVSQGIAPAGTLLTSARDVGGYFAALLNGGQRVISGGSLKEMWKPQSTISDGVQYGFGWILTRINGLEIILHTGSVEVSGSAFVIVPSQKLGVGVLGNFSNGRIEEISQGVVTLLLGGQPEPSTEPTERGPSAFKPNMGVWQKYLGDYETPKGLVRIYSEGNKLLGQTGNVQFELEAYGHNDFVLRGEVGALEGHGVSFSLETDNKITFMLDGQPFGKRK